MKINLQQKLQFSNPINKQIMQQYLNILEYNEEEKRFATLTITKNDRNI